MFEGASDALAFVADTVPQLSADGYYLDDLVDAFCHHSPPLTFTVAPIR